MTGHRTDTRGITLIELVIAMLVFALVSVMGLQSLGGMIRNRDRAVEQATRNTELGQAVAMIRSDLETIVPVLFYPPGGGTQSSVLDRPGGAGFAISVAPRHGYAPLGPTGLVQRVEYRLEQSSGVLMRRVWNTAWPVSEQAQGVETPVLTGVTGIRVRSFWGGFGWVDGLRVAQLSDAPRAPDAASGQDGGSAAPEVYSDIVPLAIEITLSTATLGELVLVEAM